MLPRQETTRVQVLHILKIVSNIQDYEDKFVLSSGVENEAQTVDLNDAK